MIEQYLRTLLEGLDSKKKILDELTNYTNKQQAIIDSDKVDWDAFDKTIDDKAELIERLQTIDDGFQSVFDRIKDELVSNKDKYASYIEELQAGIKVVTEKSTSLMALEERTKAKVTNGFGAQRKQINMNKNSSRVVNSYYNTMNKLNYVDPQLMDKKK